MYKEVGISSNNVPITLSIWYTERSSPTIVFLPGTMSHPLMYENFLCGLSERGFNIIGIHYLSHGKSPKIKKNYTMEDLLHNVYDATTYGIENFGENIAVMGSSQGGILAAMAAGRDTRLNNEKGEILHFPVDNYYYEGKRTAMFLEEKVTKYHRTLTTYLNTLLSNSFIINQIVEPQPPENMMDIPGMADEMRRPMMLIVSAKKKM